MREAADLLRNEPRARAFFALLGQSALGNGAGYVALLLLAYDRWESPWAITLVLLADLLPAMLLGPVFGAAADRWSRKWCTVVADALRAVAFAAVALTGSIELTIALAVVAGTGTGLFTPAALAGLPSLVEGKRLPAATSLYGAINDLGYTVGPALAAVVLVLSGPESLMLLNGATFAVSAVLLARLRFGAVAARSEEGEHPSLFKEARDGLRATAGMVGIRIVLVVSAAAMFFAGIYNVAELPFVEDVLGVGQVGYAVAVTVFGLGFVAGSLVGARGGQALLLKRRYLIGLLVQGLGFVATGLAPGFGLALVAFAACGLGNGLVLVYERLIVQAVVPDRLAGRVFGVKDALTAWSFGISFVVAGALLSLTGIRGLLVASGVGVLAIFALAIPALRGQLEDEAGEGPGGGSAGDGAGGAGVDVVAGEQRPDLVGGRDEGLAALDDA